MSAAEPLLAKVTGACDELGLRWHHERDSRLSAGAPGFPDLVIAGRRVIFAEIKEASRASRGQIKWLEALRQAGARVYLWHLEDWPEPIMTTLRELSCIYCQRRTNG